MKCPACAHALEGDEKACPECGLSRDALDQHCGVVPIFWNNTRTFNVYPDLTPTELNSINRCIARFEERFPQIQIAVVATRIPEPLSPGVYGFWLINRARIGPVVSPSRSYVVLFLLDRSRSCASMTVGYGLERILSEDDLQAILSAGASNFSAVRSGKALIQCIGKLSEILRGNFSRMATKTL